MIRAGAAEAAGSAWGGVRSANAGPGKRSRLAMWGDKLRRTNGASRSLAIGDRDERGGPNKQSTVIKHMCIAVVIVAGSFRDETARETRCGRVCAKGVS